jgi:hypothetical protein
MNEDTGTNIQQQDLVSDDAADAVSSAVDKELSQAASTSIGNGFPKIIMPSRQSDDTDSTPTHTSLVADIPDPSGDLHDIKQKALQQLGPLVEHLDQNPEEKFNTLIMMLRASDDKKLVQPAYDAAQNITDDKKKAQALLDIVNEVNYLTSPKDQSDEN